MDEGIVIGEGVLLDARPTSVASRLGAAVIDLLVLGVVALGVVLLAVNVVRVAPGEELLRILLVAVMALVLVVIPTAVDTLTRGRSLGKLAVGIRVVRDDGGPIRFRQALVRALAGILELWATFGSVAFIASLVHPQGKRLGDMLAGTYVVRVRGRVEARPVLTMPPSSPGGRRARTSRACPTGSRCRRGSSSGGRRDSTRARALRSGASSPRRSPATSRPARRRARTRRRSSPRSSRRAATGSTRRASAPRRAPSTRPPRCTGCPTGCPTPPAEACRGPGPAPGPGPARARSVDTAAARKALAVP